jgi:hypothetical protein
MFLRKSQFPPIRALQNGLFSKSNNQYLRNITKNNNTKTTNKKENIHEFTRNFKAAQNKEYFDLIQNVIWTRKILGDKT